MVKKRYHELALPSRALTLKLLELERHLKVRAQLALELGTGSSETKGPQELTALVLAN